MIKKGCSKEGLEWMSENSNSAIEWLTAGTHSQNIVLTVTMLAQLDAYFICTRTENELM